MSPEPRMAGGDLVLGPVLRLRFREVWRLPAIVTHYVSSNVSPRSGWTDGYSREKHGRRKQENRPSASLGNLLKINDMKLWRLNYENC